MRHLITIPVVGVLLWSSACASAEPKCDFEYVAALVGALPGYSDDTKTVPPDQWNRFEQSLPGLKHFYRTKVEGLSAVWLGWDELVKDINGVPAEALEKNSAERARLAVEKDQTGWFRFDRKRPFTSFIAVEFAQNGHTVTDWTTEIFATNHCVVAIRFRMEGGKDAVAWPRAEAASERIRAAILSHEGPTS